MVRRSLVEIADTDRQRKERSAKFESLPLTEDQNRLLICTNLQSLVL